MAKLKKMMECKKCGKRVRGVSLLKHLWKDHRAHMMKTHARGPRVEKPEVFTQESLKKIGITRQGDFLTAEEIAQFANHRDEPTFRFNSERHPLRVKLVFADGRETKLEVSNIQSLELFA